jgi:hypothetical protein
VLFTGDNLFASVVRNRLKSGIAGVGYTFEQLIAGVVDTGNKHKVVNISANFVKIHNSPKGIFRGPRETDS